MKNFCIKCGKEFVLQVYTLRRQQNAKFKTLNGICCSLKCLAAYKRDAGLTKNLFTSKRVIGDKNINWKGDGVGYDALHDWVKRHYGTPQYCENCGSKRESGRRYQWANLSGEYKRDISDWARLCHICHSLIDDRMRAWREHQQRPIREMNSRNKTGYKNVFQEKRTGKYIPYIRIAKGKQKWLGRFETAAEAYEVYKATALEMYGVY